MKKKFLFVTTLAIVALMAVMLVGCGSSSNTNKSDDSQKSDTTEKTLAEQVVDTWAVNGITDAKVFKTLDKGDEISTTDLSLENAGVFGIDSLSYKLDDENSGIYSFMKKSGSGVESVDLEYSIAGANATHCDAINITIGAGGGDQTLYYDSDNDQMIAGCDIDGDDKIDYTAVLVREDSIADNQLDLTNVKGTYKDGDDDSLKITSDGDVTVSITRLTEIEGVVTGIDGDTVSMTCLDASEEIMKLEFDTKSHVLKVVESTWEYLENGDTFTLDK